MPIEIFDQCRRMKRRSRLDEGDFTKWLIAELLWDLPLAHPDREEMLAVADHVLEIERQLPHLQLAYSLQVRRAIATNDYSVKFPYRRPPVTTPTAEGDLYVATAWSRPGLVLLGASHVPHRDRLNRLAERYGYPVDVFWTAHVSRPYVLLAEVRTKLSHMRATDAPYEDPGEWYRMTAEELRAATEQHVTAGSGK